MTHEQDAVCFYPTGRGPTHPLSASTIDGFCTHVIDERKLKIMDSLKQIENVPFFLIAATGLGKTLAVPLWLLYQMMHAKPAKALKEAGPRIWVIEPKIAIAQGLAAEMNRSWSDYSCKNGEPPFPLFGCKTKVDNLNLDAPIMFVTTGIFSIYARKGVFRPGMDFVLVDEAHVTLETDEAFELGIGICRQREVNLSYMSASVDPADIPDRLGAHVYRAEAKRFPVWRHNLGCALDDCLVRLVERTLIEPDPEDDIFPAGNSEWGGVRKSVFETARAKGMLVIVNSFSSKESDAKRLERDLRKAPFADKIRIGLLAGEVLRDPERRRRYEADLLTWKREKARYVLIATSVVEMGVTLPDLDYVVTMDSALEEVENGVRLGSLGINALIQRMGRVGRERPGIAYITKEIGAGYSSLSDEELNEPDVLKPEPIRWPTEAGRVDWLAYHSFQQGWDPDFLLAQVQALKLPSKLGHLSIGTLEAKRKEFLRFGLAADRSLTEKGKEIEFWLGFRPLMELNQLRDYVHAYDAIALFNSLLGSIIRDAAHERAEYDEHGNLEDDEQIEKIADLLDAGLRQIRTPVTGWLAEAMRWDVFETELDKLGVGWRVIETTLRRVIRISEEAKVHIEQEFKQDRHEAAAELQRRFWSEYQQRKKLLTMFILT